MHWRFEKWTRVTVCISILLLTAGCGYSVEATDGLVPVPTDQMAFEEDFEFFDDPADRIIVVDPAAFARGPVLEEHYVDPSVDTFGVALP